MTKGDMQPAWEKVVEVGFSNYDGLTNDQKVWFNMEPLIIDGIIDHYINHGADHNADTIKGLELLGFSDLAALMNKINYLFVNNQPPTDIDERNKQWDSWCDINEVLLNDIDEKFWSRCNDLENALMEHIKRTKIGE